MSEHVTAQSEHVTAAGEHVTAALEHVTAPGESMAALVRALAAAALEFDPVLPNATNPHFGSRYVTLGALIGATRPHLSRHGLVLCHTTEPQPDGSLVLVTSLLHIDGACLVSRFPLPGWKGPQDAGSVLTYLRRYSAAGLLNIASEQDDDAEQAEINGSGSRWADKGRAGKSRGAGAPKSRAPYRAAQSDSRASNNSATVNAAELADAIDQAADLGTLDALVPTLAKLPTDQRPPLRIRFSERRQALSQLTRDSAELDAVTSGEVNQET